MEAESRADAESRALARTVSCPTCGASHDVTVPPELSDTTPTPRPYRGLVGDYTKETCAAGHAFFVYYC